MTFVGVCEVTFSGAFSRDLHLGDQSRSRMEEAGLQKVEPTYPARFHFPNEQ